LVFVRAGALWAVPFDLAQLTVTGSEVPVLSGVQQDGNFGGAAYTVSDDGVLAYVPGDDTATASVGRSLVWVDRQGREEAIAAPRALAYPRVSPDGERLAVAAYEPDNWDIWIYDLVRGGSSRLTFDSAVDDRPEWTPDGERIIFRSSRQNGGELFWKAANGTGTSSLLYTSSANSTPSSFSPDGDRLAFVSLVRDFDIHLLSVADEPTAEPLLETAYNEGSPAISPDGRWLAYASDETGSAEIYVRPFPNVEEGKWQISVDGGQEPLWGADSTELFFRGSSEFFSVPINTADEFSWGSPIALFQDTYLDRNNLPSYDVSPDGERFLMLQAPAQLGQDAPQTELVVVTNWFDELNRLVPTD